MAIYVSAMEGVQIMKNIRQEKVRNARSGTSVKRVFGEFMGRVYLYNAGREDVHNADIARANKAGIRNRHNIIVKRLRGKLYDVNDNVKLLTDFAKSALSAADMSDGRVKQILTNVSRVSTNEQVLKALNNSQFF